LEHSNGILGLPIQSSCNCYGPCHCNSCNFKCLDLEIRDGGTFSSVFSLLNFLCFGGDCVEQQVKVLQVGDKSAKVCDKVEEGLEAVKLLSRVEQLRLLSKVKKAGLLSAAENFGLSLSSIEKLGLLSKAEDLGVLSTVTDRSTPCDSFCSCSCSPGNWPFGHLSNSRRIDPVSCATSCCWCPHHSWRFYSICCIEICIDSAEIRIMQICCRRHFSFSHLYSINSTPILRALIASMFVMSDT
jgi:hypothetical protein